MGRTSLPYFPCNSEGFRSRCRKPAFDNASQITDISDSSDSTLAWTFGYYPKDPDARLVSKSSVEHSRRWFAAYCVSEAPEADE